MTHATLLDDYETVLTRDVLGNLKGVGPHEEVSITLKEAGGEWFRYTLSSNAGHHSADIAALLKKVVVERGDRLPVAYLLKDSDTFVIVVAARKPTNLSAHGTALTTFVATLLVGFLFYLTHWIIT